MKGNRCVRGLVLAAVLWGWASASGWAQELPPEAAGQFRQAIQSLQSHDYGRAEEMLRPLVRRFPDHADAQEALAMALVFQGKAQAATPHFEQVIKLKPLSPQAHQNLGANYLRVGRPKEAEREFREALKLQPDNPTIHYNLGSLYIQQQNYQEALPHLQRAYRQQPHIYENSHQLALCYFFLSRHQEAQKLLAHLEPVGSKRAEYLILHGLNEKALGNDAAARRAFDRALPILPSSPQAYEVVGQMFFQLGLYQEAVPVFQRAVDKYPDFYQVAYSLAVAYQGAGAPEEARTVARTALQKWDTADLHHLLGEVNEELENYTEAMQHFRRAAELDPSARNIFDLGYEFLAHWNWNLAFTVFRQGLNLHPESGRLWLGLATAHYGQGEYNQATEALLKAAQAEPDNPIAYHLLANTYPFSEGYTEGVRKRLRRFLQRSPDDPWANYYYGFTLAQPPDQRATPSEIKEAMRLLRRAVSLKPDFPEAQYQLGLILSEQQEWQQATQAFEATVRLQPDHVTAHYRLALAYRRLGKTAEAKAMLARYQELKAKQESELERRAAETIRFVQRLQR